MSYYIELKSKNDIIEVAKSLGFNGTKSGNSWQGDCPRHGSSGGKCLVIWPGIQGFKCYHCGKTGDVISLVTLYKRCDHATAVNYLADRVGMSHLSGTTQLSAEQLRQRQADIQEEALVYDILTKAAQWFHRQLKNFPDIVDHLNKHYCFSQEIIEELQIGFAPPGTSAPEIKSDLAEYLASIQGFGSGLVKSGLFSFSSPDGPYWDYFKGRIMFPYWKNGKVVNMIARATPITPIDEFECYTDNQKNAKIDASGQPMYVKYKKLRRHDPDHDKRKHISKFIGTETFMGSDAIRGAKEIIITEGAPDWVSAVDHGISALSPVTTNFRDEDMEKLVQATSGAKAVYIINDNEENQAGLTGALRTGKYLTSKGRQVFLVELPRPQGLSKIDLNEYLRDHSAEDLRKLMQSAKSVLDAMIDDLPADYVKAQPVLKAEILPIMLGLDEGIRVHYLDRIRKAVKTSKMAVAAELEEAKRITAAQKQEAKQPAIDPAIQTLAESIARNPALMRNRIDAVNKSGVVGERNVVAMYFAALDSRLLPEDTASPNALAIKNAGHHGSGKSFAMKKCLELYPEGCYHLITSGSAKSLYYLPDGLKHRALIVAEAFQFQANNAADSEFVYVVRSLLSEGRVSYQVPQKDENGKFTTIEKRLDGPTSFITTTIIDKLEPQLEDRLFTIHPDESMQQTRSIMTITAKVKDGSFEGIDESSREGWKLFHSTLKPVDVVIPFASQISEYLQRGEKLPIATRRAFNRVMAIIQTVVCAYQFQRSQDAKGRLKAEISDYWMALQIVREAFRETLGQQSREAAQRIEFIRQNGPVQYGTLTFEWGVSKAALTGWVRGKLYDNVLTWCDVDGGEFADDAALKKAKHSGKAYLKVNVDFQVDDVTGLPTPFELTGDPLWDEGGQLYHLYDLALDQGQIVENRASGDFPESKSCDEAATEEAEEAEPAFDFKKWNPLGSDCAYF
jgi:DNA primase